MRYGALLLSAYLLPSAAAAQGPAAPSPGSPGQIPTVADEVTVTATRTEQRLADTAASVVVLSAADLAASAAPTVDDALRQVPGFSLFRRTGSRWANPTAQGVSLRGLGASGASRAAVLADGVPVNDPFGGWVAWGRVPRAALARVELMRGAASDLYGSGALGGVVQLVRRAARTPAVVADASWGERASGDGSLFAALTTGATGAWGWSAAGEGARTDGYVAVDPAMRGAVDTPVASRHDTAEVTAERWTAAAGRLLLRGSRYHEDRANGTPLQANDETIRQWSAAGDWGAGGGTLALRAWGGNQDYHQTFSAVAADRATERLSRTQSVPADTAGGSLQASRPLGDRQALVGGVELREVNGTSEETVFTGGVPVPGAAGGRQRTAGLFVEDVAHLSPRLSLTVGGRFDSWQNDGHRRSGSAPEVPLARRDESAWSPRATLLFQATGSWAWTASAYKAFRAPTLNELYRSFRVGDALTLANDSLRAERLTGGETGALYRGAHLTARGTLFWMDVDQNIANVTLAIAPGLITRQRANLGSTRSRGAELEATERWDRWSLAAGWLLADARVTSAPAQPDLVGRRLPQVPRQQATLALRFADPRLAAALQARWSGEQFDDDQNRFRLRSATTVDALVSRPLGAPRLGLAAFIAAENLLGARVEAGRTPLVTLGPPRIVRIGLRLER